jgi:hypothetical protein
MSNRTDEGLMRVELEWLGPPWPLRGQNCDFCEVRPAIVLIRKPGTTPPTVICEDCAIGFVADKDKLEDLLRRLTDFRYSVPRGAEQGRFEAIMAELKKERWLLGLGITPLPITILIHIGPGHWIWHFNCGATWWTGAVCSLLPWLYKFGGWFVGATGALGALLAYAILKNILGEYDKRQEKGRKEAEVSEASKNAS